MSANFCEANPVQSALNYHCFHPIGKPIKHAKDKRVLRQRTRCCWCGDEQVENIFVAHGPLCNKG